MALLFHSPTIPVSLAPNHLTGAGCVLNGQDEPDTRGAGGHDCLSGLADWPDLDHIFETVGRGILGLDFEAGLSAGFKLSPDGRLTLGDPSGVAYAIVSSFAEAEEGFHWTDGTGCRWASRMRVEYPARPGAWLAHGITVDRNCRLLDPDYRERVLQRLITRLDFLFCRRHRLSDNGYRQRTKLVRQVCRLSRMSQGFSLLPWFAAHFEQGRAPSIKAESAVLAGTLWGKDSSLWPLHWQDELVVSAAMLSRLQYVEIEFAKTGWRPRLATSETALQSVRQQGEDLILSFSPGFFDFVHLLCYRAPSN